MNETVITDKQSVLDIAILTTGSAERAMDIALQNGLSLSEDVQPGTVLQTPETVQNRQTVQYFNVNTIAPATALNEETIVNGGINYMGIEIDFIIS
ncbi:MAG: hypothetical protein II937_10600 [Bacteroidales bacterium]|nr:hypothetical protein [Bacteroidales bacterium]